jgi:hypothetical protein
MKRTRETRAEQRAAEDRGILRLVADLLNLAHAQYAFDGDRTAGNMLFVGGLYSDVFEQLQGRCDFGDLQRASLSVTKLPTVLAVGRRMVEDFCARHAIAKVDQTAASQVKS